MYRCRWLCTDRTAHACMHVIMPSASDPGSTCHHFVTSSTLFHLCMQVTSTALRVMLKGEGLGAVAAAQDQVLTAAAQQAEAGV